MREGVGKALQKGMLLLVQNVAELVCDSEAQVGQGEGPACMLWKGREFVHGLVVVVACRPSLSLVVVACRPSLFSLVVAACRPSLSLAGRWKPLMTTS